MGNQTIKERIIDYIGNIGWKIFTWAYKGGEDQYFKDIKEGIIIDHIKKTQVYDDIYF